MDEAIIRALTQAKHNAETPPPIFTAENRDRVQFLVGMIVLAVSFLGAVITATTIWVSMRQDLSTAKQNITQLQVDATAAKTTAERNAVELIRQAKAYDPLIENVRSLIDQRAYGFDNSDWWRAQHPGASPPSRR